MKQDDNIEKLNWVSILLICISIIFVIISFFLPYIFTHFSMVDFTETGPIGDTIGGIMNPFISIASVAMMFLAFYMQYNANKLQRQLFNEQIKNEKTQFSLEIAEQRKQFERNQFENQFFEMLKTHKENSNIIATTHYESVEGRGFGEDIARLQWLETRKKGFEYLVDQINERYDEFKKQNKKTNKDKNFSSAYSGIWEDSFGHYFRHLFLIVKFIVSKPEDFLSYEEKRNYLRILRASLSTYEQIFLYYNWLSGYGSKWENDSNHFFTDYRMIHNVNFGIHKDFEIKSMSPFKELLINKNYRKERNKKDDDLFELIK